MEIEQEATLKDLKSHYGRIYYKATDANYYKLSDYYPYHFDVKGRPDCICLDTGGVMADCDFGIFKVEEGKLLRENDSGRGFKVVSPKLVVI